MDQHQTAEHLKQVIETQSMLAQAGFDLEVFMNLVVERMLLLTPATGCVVELVEDNQITYKAASGSVAPYVGLKLNLANSLTGLSVRDREIKISEDTSDDPRVDLAACKRVGASSMVLVPLMRHGEPLGVLKVLSNKTNAFSTDDIATLQLMAALLGGALGQQLEIEQRKQLEETLRHRTQELEDRNTQLMNVLAELEKTSAELQEKNVQAHEATRLKSEFLANMSHEIRTPLNAIIGFTDILTRTEIAKQHREYLHCIRDAGRGLIALIGDILDFSKIEAGKMNIELIDFDLIQAIKGASHLMMEQCQAKGLQLDTNIDARLPQRAIGDPGRLRQILINLIGNAVKFSSKGSIKVCATLETENANNSIVARFSVADEGVGMSAEEVAKLFQPFVQADGSTTRKYGGTGLGLSICKRLCELMGGEIGVSSKKGEGATFWFTLPFERSTAQKSGGDEAADSLECMSIRSATEVDFHPGLILVAEDHPANQMVAQLQLKQLGLSAHLANNGLEALDALKSNEYAAVLLDCQMPEMDGFATSREIRKRETGTNRRVPIIAMTANAMQGDKDACIAAGMDDYVSKPVELDQLAQVLRKWLALDESYSTNTDQDPLPACSDEGTKTAIDIDALVGMFGVNSVRKLISGFIADTDHSMEILQTTLTNQDRTGMNAIAHKMVGSCGTLRAKELHALSDKLDAASRVEDWDMLNKICAEVTDAYARVRNQSLAFVERCDN